MHLNCDVGYGFYWKYVNVCGEAERALGLIFQLMTTIAYLAFLYNGAATPLMNASAYEKVNK